MRRLLVILLALVVWMLQNASRGDGVELLGGGATFPYPLYSKMFYEYWKMTGIKVNYQAIGSGGGQRQLINMTVDFGASDAFMSDGALAEAPARILHIPTCLGAVVLAYNLPEKPELRLTPKLISDIFLGRITRWDDERIREVNPQARLPEMDILVIHRSDGSGTTFVFTDYLSKVNREWEKEVGRGKAVNWPVGVGSKGNPGVTGLIKHLPGTIGYVELGYALMEGMPVAILENRAGQFIRPSPVSASMAANIPLPEDTRVSLTDTAAPGGYPMSSFTWLLIYQEQAYRRRPMGKARELAKLLWWITHEGQRYGEALHYAPLPDEAVKKGEHVIRSVTFDGKPIFQ